MLLISTLSPASETAIRTKWHEWMRRNEKDPIKHDAYFLAPMHKMENEHILASYELSDTPGFKWLPDSDKVWTEAWANILRGEKDFIFSKIQRDLINRYGTNTELIARLDKPADKLRDKFHEVHQLTRALNAMAPVDVMAKKLKGLAVKQHPTETE
eukprot:TRINITY_DN15019_c0_g1_i1.p1 TRINITY_DN15019_c0_g1~~TRINITY_DN15019_c0_g1_i1.p1  ORF type:complete len:156 (-),score=30.92 TRINITY_DN15019_c0_g1_i1:260-727(-)